MNPITPTVGRIVWFIDDLVRVGKQQPYPAIITHVWGETCVNLDVFRDRSFPAGERCNATATSPHQCSNVILVQPGQQPPEKEDYCEWMPYQVGQAPASSNVQQQLSDLERRLALVETKTEAPPS